MNPELLTCRRITAGLLYPPFQIQTADLNRLYADITERYPYQVLQHLPDGVRMANQEDDCFIQFGRIQMNDNVTYFQANRNKFLDIFGMVRDRLSLQQFVTFGVKLTASLPMTGPDAAVKFLDSSLLGVDNSNWDLLGSGRKGAGMRVLLVQDGLINLHIEPLFNDTSELYIDLDIQYSEPFIGLDSVGPKMDAAYEYLFGSVLGFLKSLR